MKTRMEERGSGFFFWLCSRVVGAAHFLGSVLALSAAKLGEELDVSVFCGWSYLFH